MFFLTEEKPSNDKITKNAASHLPRISDSTQDKPTEKRKANKIEEDKEDKEDDTKRAKINYEEMKKAEFLSELPPTTDSLSQKIHVDESIPCMSDGSSDLEPTYDTDSSTGSLPEGMNPQEKYVIRKMRNMTKAERRKFRRENQRSFKTTIVDTERRRQDREQMKHEDDLSRINQRLISNQFSSTADSTTSCSTRVEIIRHGIESKTHNAVVESKPYSTTRVTTQRATWENIPLQRKDVKIVENVQHENQEKTFQMSQHPDPLYWWHPNMDHVHFHRYHTTEAHVYHEFKDWRFIKERPIPTDTRIYESWDAFVLLYNKGEDAWYQTMYHLTKLALKYKPRLIDQLRHKDLGTESALYAVRNELNLHSNEPYGEQYENRWDNQVVSPTVNWNANSNTLQPRQGHPDSADYEAPRYYPDSRATSPNIPLHSSSSYDQLCSRLHTVESRLNESEALVRAMKSDFVKKDLATHRKLLELSGRETGRYTAVVKNNDDHFRIQSRRYVELCRRVNGVERGLKPLQDQVTKIQLQLKDFLEKEKVADHPVLFEILTRLTLLESQLESLKTRTA